MTILALALTAMGALLVLLDLGRQGRLGRFRDVIRRRSADAQSQMDLVEAIASWTENLRDLLASSSGLEQAIITSQEYAPRRLAAPVRKLAADLRYRTLEDSLRDFADAVSHPTCDFVVLALVSTIRGSTRDLVPLLGQLADCARSECDLYLRVWVSRARSRTAVRIIFGSVALFTSGLALFNPGYVAPFMSREGSIFLTATVCMFATALIWIARISRVPDRGRLIRQRVMA